MVAVQIAELKNKLSAYLKHVRRGEEILINDRKTPIAKIVPLRTDNLDEDDLALAAEGILRLPDKPFDPDAFFAIGKGIRTPKATRKALDDAMRWTREDLDVSFFGRKRSRTPKRKTSGKRPRKTAA
jgi:prevent-host-death family protein